MQGIVIGVSPVIAQVGPFTLRWYSLIVVLAIVAGCWLGLREAAGKGLDVDQVQSLANWAVIGGLAGAPLFHVIDRCVLYAVDPRRAFAIWEGGLAVECGLGGGIVGLACALRHRIPARTMADAAAVCPVCPPHWSGSRPEKPSSHAGWRWPPLLPSAHRHRVCGE